MHPDPISATASAAISDAPTSTALRSSDSGAEDAAWHLALAAAALAGELGAATETIRFSAGDAQGTTLAADGPTAKVLAWQPGEGWQLLLSPDDPRAAILDLYLPLCNGTESRPITVGHLGQSLDGFIATHGGDSQFVTGHENIVHLHRMRALCDAVVVGAGTVAADDPQLTTRHVDGPSPLRVIFDPGRRLGINYRVFEDETAPTLYVCARQLVDPGETHIGNAEVVGIEGDDQSVDVSALLMLLHARGCWKVFVEGGGVTVSAFLGANLLDRLHVAIAPLIIGDGRPAIRLPAPAALRDCARPPYRVFRMGGDVLFDCDLRGAAPIEAAGARSVARVI